MFGSLGKNKIGGYYNYCAASAGSPSGNATEDICPAGWRMPTGGVSGEYQALYDEYSSNDSFKTALSTPLSGIVDGGTVTSQGELGFFWTSTYYGAKRMYNLNVRPIAVYPAIFRLHYDGLSVRCLFNQ